MAFLATTKTNTAMSGLGRQTSFGMDLNAKSYEILMEGLYEEPIRAMVREMTCNMNDSHVLRDQLWHRRTAMSAPMPSHYQSLHAEPLRNAGRNDSELVERLETLNTSDVHYEVHMPSQVSPHITFQDHGVGLHIDDIIGERQYDLVDGEEVYLGRSGGLFTTLFRSTKEGSNDFIGALGLGCKTPYALSPTFTMRSVHKGRVHYYLGMKNDEGIPTCMCTSEIINDATGDSQNPDGDLVDEKDGITITIPCPQDKFTTITNFAEELFRVFEKPPIVHGGSYHSQEFNRDQKVASTYIQQAGPFSTKGHFVLMGNVAYPIRTDFLPPAANKMLSLMGGRSYTVFQIGSLDFQPSRDGLNYSDRTREALRVYFTSFSNVVAARYRAELAHSARDGVHAMWRKMNEMRRTIGDDFLNAIDFKFNDQKISTKTPMNVNIGTVTRTVTRADDTVKEYQHPIASIRKVGSTGSRSIVRYGDKYLTAIPFRDLEAARDVDKEIIIIAKSPETKFWRRRYERLFIDTASSAAARYQIQWDGKATDDMSESKMFEIFLSEFGEYVDTIRFVNLDDIEPMPTEASQMKSQRIASGERTETAQVLRYLGGSSGEDSYEKIFKDNYEDIEEGALYVDITRWEADISQTSMSLFNRLNKDKTIYAIRRSGRKQIKVNNLVPLSESIDMIETHFDDIPMEVARYQAAEHAIKKYNHLDGKTVEKMMTNPIEWASIDIQMHNKWCLAVSLKSLLHWANITVPAVEEYSRLIGGMKASVRRVTIEEHTIGGLEELGMAHQSVVTGGHLNNNQGMLDAALVAVYEFTPGAEDVINSGKWLMRNNLLPYNFVPTFDTVDHLVDCTLAIEMDPNAKVIPNIKLVTSEKLIGESWNHWHSPNRNCSNLDDLYSWAKAQHYDSKTQQWFQLAPRRNVRTPFWDNADREPCVRLMDPIFKHSPNRFQTLVA